MTVMTLNPLPWRLQTAPCVALVWKQMDLHSLTPKGYHRGTASEDSITSRRQRHKAAAAANKTTQTSALNRSQFKVFGFQTEVCKSRIRQNITASLPAHLQLWEYGSTQAVKKKMSWQIKGKPLISMMKINQHKCSTIKFYRKHAVINMAFRVSLDKQVVDSPFYQKNKKFHLLIWTNTSNLN